MLAATFGLVGYLFGRNLPRIEQILHGVGLGGVMVAALVILLILRRRAGAPARG